MPTVDETRNKVQRILTQHGRVEIDKDGDFVVRKNSAVVFVRTSEGFGDNGTLVEFTCPLLVGVSLTPDVYKWVATIGQQFRIGGCSVWIDNDDPTKGEIMYEYSIIGDDIDESELMAGVYATLFTCDDLDNQLRDMFGGELFGEED